MTASVTTGKPTMSASCNARHWTSRLHTEPMINASATVRIKLLRSTRRHCHHHTMRPNKNAAVCQVICSVWNVCSGMMRARIESGSSRMLSTLVNRNGWPVCGSSMRSERMPATAGASGGTATPETPADGAVMVVGAPPPPPAKPLTVTDSTSGGVAGAAFAGAGTAPKRSAN